MTKNHVITIDKAVYGGYGLAFHKDIPFFVPLGLPGETCEVEIYLKKKDIAFAAIRRIHEASPYRTEPQCPQFTICGGCDYLHVPYDYELEMKKAILKDTLKRIAKINEHELPGIKTVRGPRFHYRSHCMIKNHDNSKGFYKRKSNDIATFPPEGCRLLANEINIFIKNIKSLHKELKIAVDPEGTCSQSDKGNQEICEKNGGLIFRRSLHNFYQSNMFLREEMLSEVKAHAGLDKTKTLVDIYCGVGFFTLSAGQYAQRALGFDSDRAAVDYARKNASFNEISHAEFTHLRSSDINPSRYKPDVLIIDPPRAGMDKKTRKTVQEFSCNSIIYISCNPSTFSRDIKDLVHTGYSIKALTLIDMFPCTHHIEVIACLGKK